MYIFAQKHLYVAAVISQFLVQLCALHIATTHAVTVLKW